jgi:predicted nucleic acid-binding protein
VPDTTALIQAIRTPRPALFDSILRGQVWFSAVVACELYAGTRSMQERRLVEQLVRGAGSAQRLLVPSADEWGQAGNLMARRVRLYGPMRPRDHLADVLIVVSAARVAGEVVTANRGHFEAWAALARRAGLDVTLGSATY